MGRESNRKFESAKQMWEEWERYKYRCDNMCATVSDFCSKLGEYVSAKVPRRVTYTVKGFSLWCNMTEQNFYATYAHNPKFESVIARMKEECEIDAREKFELGVIDPRLAGLWMSNYGYSTKNDESISGAVPVVISGGDKLDD